MTVVLPAPVASLSAHQLRIGLGIRRISVGEVFEIFLTCLAQLRGHLGHPDGGFHRLDLAEERPNAAELMVTPVVKQAGRFLRDPPLRLGKFPPAIHLLSYAIDDGGVDVLLILRRKVIKQEVFLFGSTLLLFRLWYGCNELSRPSSLYYLLRRLPAVIQLPMTGRILVG